MGNVRPWLDSVSIRWKLTVAIAALWIAAVGGLAWIAYAQVVAAERGAAAERLGAVSRQLAESIEGDVSRTVAAVGAIAARQPVVALLRSGTASDRPVPLTDAPSRTAAIAALADSGRRPERIAATELWDRAARRVIITGRDSAAIGDLDLRLLQREVVAADSGLAGGFRRLGDSLVIPLAAPVRDAGRTIGYVVQWRHVLNPPAQREQMLQLIGDGSALLLGTPEPGGIWTDLVTAVPPPPLEPAPADGPARYSRPGLGDRLAVTTPIAETPWLLVLELSERAVLAPARRFLERVTAIAATVLLFGLAGVWFLTQRMTRRLSRLAEAAEAVSAAPGGSAMPLPGGSASGDEVSRLGSAFARMETRVAETHRALEANLAELQATRDRFAHTQRMEAVGRLAGGVAHDFNNLLTVILGGVELALMSDDPVERETLLEIRAAGERAAGLTAQLLAFSRRQITAPTVVDMNDVTRDLDRMLVRLIGENVRLATRPVEGPAAVRVDRGQIEQVLVNLAVNARDAMPDGGTILIEVGRTTLSEEYAATRPDAEPGAYVVVAVSDTGTGMSEEVKQHLFEPFFTTKEPGRGTGLGLATCYGIVKESGGHISVYSELGVGTTVRVYLPHAGPADVPTETPRAEPPLGDETILLVEDEVAVRQIAARILAAYGYRVVEAGDAEAALAHLAGSQKVDLLVTDVVLPGIGGRVLAERAAEARPGLRVLFMSGYTDDVVLQHQLVHRTMAFVQKPFTPESLGRGVRVALDGA